MYENYPENYGSDYLEAVKQNDDDYNKTNPDLNTKELPIVATS
jgi:hypothetical protein